jgi:hypothetical protein
MKKSVFLVLIFLLQGMMLSAQVPGAFKYQAVIRNATGDIQAGKPVSLKISILSGTASGAVIYSETHINKMTNQFGLIDVEIGNGTVSTGSFSSIDWGNNSYFVKIEIDPAGGTNYQSMGTSQLLSVPYALYAKDVRNNNDNDADPANELQELQLSGSVLGLTKSTKTVTLPSGPQTWVANGNNIYYNTGNVGISTQTPITKLQIGEVYSGVAGNWNDTTRYGVLVGNETDFAYFGLSHEGGDQDHAVIQFGDNQDNTFRIYSTNSGNVRSELLRLTFDGKLGIGTKNPTQLLDVRGSIALGNYNTTNISRKIGITDGTTLFGGMEIENTTLGGIYSQKLHFTTHHYNSNTGRRMTINEDGKIGIGVENPSQKLEIDGNMKMNNSNLGILLNDANNPLITRQRDVFTSGTYNGAGRWGLFQDGGKLILGCSGTFGGNGFQFVSYNDNSSIDRILMNIEKDNGLKVYSHTGNPMLLEFSGTGNSADNSGLRIKNTNNSNGGADARLTLTSTSEAGGDAFTSYEIEGIQSFTSGIANKDNKFHITRSYNFDGSYTDFTMDQSGNVGIGTDVPTDKLTVNGSLYVEGVSTFKNNINWSANTNILMKNSGDFTFDFDNYDGNSIWGVWNGGMILAVRNNGRVGISNTNPNYKLDVSGGDINVNGVYRTSGQAGISVNLTVVTAVQQNGAFLQKKTRTIIVNGGIITGVGSESDWLTIQ